MTGGPSSAFEEVAFDDDKVEILLSDSAVPPGMLCVTVTKDDLSPNEMLDGLMSLEVKPVASVWSCSDEVEDLSLLVTPNVKGQSLSEVLTLSPSDKCDVVSVSVSEAVEV